MRTVLVCVRTPMAAQSIASCAARLGVGTVRTAVTEAEALARLAEAPAELILADTAVTRPDVVGFTQRVLAASPRAVLVLFGAEDPRLAAAAVAAGARGLIRGIDQEPVATVMKAMLLIGAASRSPAPPGKPTAPAPPGKSAAPAPGRSAPGSGRPAVGAPGRPPHPPGQPTKPWPAGAGTPRQPQPTLVPAQRSDLAAGAAAAAVASLTERELQVLRGMAEGKSNAEIGRELYVSEDTVKTHARRLFRKLGARDRAHAVAVGFRAGMLG